MTKRFHKGLVRLNSQVDLRTMLIVVRYGSIDGREWQIIVAGDFLEGLPQS